MVSLPAVVLVLGCLTLTVVVALASRWGIAKAVPASERDHVQSIAAPLMPALGAAFALLMGLTLATEFGYLRSAQDIVSNEAAQASRLAWASTSPRVHTNEIQGALDDYLRTTRSEEWESDEQDEPAAAETLAALERVVRTAAARSELGTPASGELLTSWDGVSAARRSRLAAASRDLPWLYVVTLAASGIALLANAGALAFRSSLRTSVLLLGLAVVVAFSMALLFAVTAPFHGALVADGEPVDAVIRDLEAGFFQP